VVVEPEVAVPREFPDHAFDQRQRRAEPFVVARPLGQVGEHSVQVRAGVAQPAGLAVIPEEGLGDREADQFGVAEQGRSANASDSPDLVVDLHVQCGQEGV